MPQTLRSPQGAHARRLQQLGCAFEAYRRACPGQRFPSGLRAQVVAVLEAGASPSAVSSACGLSWTQLRHWRKAAAVDGGATPVARVLSVVDSEPQRSPAALDDELELRIGPWHLRLRRVPA